MAIDTIVGEKKIIINESYLRKCNSLEGLYRMLDKDLTIVCNGGEVHLIHPRDIRLNPVFADVLSYVCAKAIRGDYIIKPTNDYDAGKIRAILGGNVVGNLQEGYRFQRKHKQ